MSIVALNTTNQLSDFCRKYRNDVFDPSNEPKVAQFANKLFELLSVVWGDALTSCNLYPRCFEEETWKNPEKPKCRAECDIPDAPDSKILFQISYDKILSMFFYSNNTEIKFAFQILDYTSIGMDGKRDGLRKYMVEYMSVDSADKNIIYFNEAEPLRVAYGSEKVRDLMVPKVEDEEKILEHFSASLKNFRGHFLKTKAKDSTDSAEGNSTASPASSQAKVWPIGAIFAGVGVMGVGLGLYAKRRSRQKELQKINDPKTPTLMLNRDVKKASKPINSRA